MQTSGIHVECTSCAEFLVGARIINSGHQPAEGLIIGYDPTLDSYCIAYEGTMENFKLQNDEDRRLDLLFILEKDDKTSDKKTLNRGILKFVFACCLCGKSYNIEYEDMVVSGMASVTSLCCIA